MAAQQQDLAIDQGTDYRKPLCVINSDGSPEDISGSTAAMEIRASVGDPTALLTLTTENNGLIVEGANGLIILVIDAAVTAAIIAGRYVYDLKLRLATGKIRRTHQGALAVSPEVTITDPYSPSPSPSPSPAPSPSPSPTPSPDIFGNANGDTYGNSNGDEYGPA